MRKLGLRIILGYLLLTATLCAAVWFIVKSARAVSEVSDAARVVASQRKASNRLIAHLFESNTMGETATLQYASDEASRRYLESVVRTDSALEALKKVTVNHQQLARLDTLSLLLTQKCKRVIDLVETLRRDNHQQTNLAQQIEELRSGRKPVEVGTQVSIPVVEHDEEVVIERRKKKFFQRLGDAFRKAKDDTVMTTTSTRTALPDSAHAKVDISDTLAHILTDVHRDLTRDSQAKSQRVNRQTTRLRKSSAALSRRMALLMEDFTREQQQLIAFASQQDTAQRTRAAWQMGGVALVATLAALVLFVWVWRDMSRANRYREALEQAKEETEELMKRREQLLLTISHDIKAPVNTVLGYLSLLQPHTAPAAQSHLAALDASAHHLLDLVTALLDYHRLEAGGLAVDMRPTPLFPLLESVTRAFAPLAEKKGLELTTTFDLPTSLTISTDAFRLRQILENLLSNALKYTQRGGVRLTAQVNDEKVSIAVRDTGCGLSRYDCERIFTPFTRVKGSEGQEGTGLGLSITQKLAELLQGELSVKSEMGVGSTFTLHLPLGEEDSSDTASQVETNTAIEALSSSTASTLSAVSSIVLPATPSSAKGKEALSSFSSDVPNTATNTGISNAHCLSAKVIAVLDDDALQLRLTEAMLRNVLPADTTIATFLAPDAFFGWWSEGHRPDVFFTDIEMPQMTGYEVLALLRKQVGAEHLPVIATTSHSLIAAEEFEERGFTKVLFKPFTQNDLREVLLPARGLSTASSANDGEGETLLKEAEGQEEAMGTTDATKGCDVPPTTDARFAPLLYFAEGDPEAEQAIMKQFRDDCEVHLKRLDSAIELHDKAALCQLAHKLLPTFTLIASPVVPALRLLDGRRAETMWREEEEDLAERIREELRGYLR